MECNDCNNDCNCNNGSGIELWHVLLFGAVMSPGASISAWWLLVPLFIIVFGVIVLAMPTEPTAPIVEFIGPPVAPKPTEPTGPTDDQLWDAYQDQHNPKHLKDLERSWNRVKK